MVDPVIRQAALGVVREIVAKVAECVRKKQQSKRSWGSDYSGDEDENNRFNDRSEAVQDALGEVADALDEVVAEIERVQREEQGGSDAPADQG